MFKKDNSLKIQKNQLNKKHTRLPLKPSKKFRVFKQFKQAFLFTKKTTLFKRLQTYFNESRLVWSQFLKNYSKKNRISELFTYKNKIGEKKFFFFLQKLELRLSTLLIRSRFFFKLTNAYNAIKLNLILVNGILINNTNFHLNELDLFQKRRTSLILFFNKKTKRLERLKWRNFRWKKARFIFWKIRKQSNLNLFLAKKENSILNYLEINYKIPAAIVLRPPFFSELILKNELGILKPSILQKIYYVF